MPDVRYRIRRETFMHSNGVIKNPEWIKNKCPFCYENLGIKENMKRRIKKVCQCPRCHRKIDERFLIY